MRHVVPNLREQPDTQDERQASAAVWALGVTQIIGYGTLYYAFSILAPGIARDLSWSLEWVFAAFSAALLAGGLAAPGAGRLVDRFGAGAVMVWGSIAAAVALAGTAFAPERVSFVVGLVAIEVASTFVLYDAAFAALVQMRGEDAKRRITHLTLIAGFASTLFWPATSALNDYLSWREVFLIFAVLNLLVCVPLHLWLARAIRVNRTWTSGDRGAGGPAKSVPGSLSEAERPRAFMLVAFAFSASGFVLSAMLIHMVPMLESLGLGASAALIGMLFGPAQVLSRLTNMTFGGGLSPVGLALFSASLLPVALLALLWSAPSFAGAVAFAILLGLGSGLVSIVRGTVPLALFGSVGYGQRLGQFTAIRLVVMAVAPFLFALAMARFGTPVALGIATALGGSAVVALCLVGHFARDGVTSPGA